MQHIFDFTFGNPQEMPIPGYAAALQKWVPPHNKDWYAYKLSEAETRQCIAESLLRWRGAPFDAEDIAVTNGDVGRQPGAAAAESGRIPQCTG